MPAIIRRLVIIAAVDGLFLQPLHQKNQRGLKIDYASQRILPADGHPGKGAALECHGIIGLLTVPPQTYLILISGRQQVGQIRGAPIFVITDVTFVPATSQSEAEKAISYAKDLQRKEDVEQDLGHSDTDLSDEEEEGGRVESQTPRDDDNSSPVSSGSYGTVPSPKKEAENPENSSSVAEDVIGRKGQYGRFADRWFSKKGWTADRRKSQGMSSDIALKIYSKSDSRPDIQRENSNAFSSPEDGSRNENPVKDSHPVAPITGTLLPKLLQTSRLLLSSRSFFYSLDMDITRRLGDAPQRPSDIPLHRSVDTLFFWNSHLALPFIEGGHHPFVIPIMQGFVGQKSFSIRRQSGDREVAELASAEGKQEASVNPQSAESDVENPDFLMTLISRRSVKRPGLRYLRRGVDDDGNTANSVETEQMLSKEDWSGKVYSFTQIRGSIPLFFSQLPYAFKPVPVLQHSAERNHNAFKRHFKAVSERYGGVQIVLLVDKTGGEAAIGRRYEESTDNFNDATSNPSERLGFEWFDFHNVCRGMKFENVSILIDKVGSCIAAFGDTEKLDDSIQKSQKGVIRTNCMDCLDRTNVVQSAFGQKALEAQLEQEGFKFDFQKDSTTQWFNLLWADNGDAISKQYSSTAALKGDYTRTRRRNYRGAINDLGLTLSRYYNNIVNDYFSQAAIDYLLGNVTVQVFQDFEDKMMSADPGMSMQKIRENAINTSIKIVIEDGKEDLVGGWTMLSPSKSNSLTALPFEETVMLLTDLAVYRVCFDWNSDKVISFERVDLQSIINIIKGIYITSTLTSAQIDESKNLGFIVRYRPGKEDITRVNTRSLSNAVGIDGTEEPGTTTSSQRSKASPDEKVKIFAFKALPARSTSTTEGLEQHNFRESDMINNVCDAIQRVAVGEKTTAESAHFVKETAIISLAEAKRNTGMIDQLSHALKRFVWG